MIRQKKRKRGHYCLYFVKALVSREAYKHKRPTPKTWKENTPQGVGRCVRACLVLCCHQNLPDLYESKATTHRIPANRWIKYTNIIAIRNAGVLDYFSFCQIKPDPAKTLTDCIRPRLTALPENAILSWQAGIVRFLCKWVKKHGTEKSMPQKGWTIYRPHACRHTYRCQ